jgi:hypothetical protein
MGNTTEVVIDVPGQPDHIWDINSIDWSTDRQPCPIGSITITDDNETTIWQQFFNDVGNYSRIFGCGVLYLDKGQGFRITVAGEACTKTLCVFYR